MKLILIMLTFPFLVFSRTHVMISGQTQDLTSTQRALVLESNSESELVVFKVCDVKQTKSLQIDNCSVMGKKQGYTLAEIEKRVIDLEKNSSTGVVLQSTYVVLGTALGMLAGAVIGQQLALVTNPSQMYGLISYFTGGLVVGGGMGLTLTLLTKDKVISYLNPMLEHAQATAQSEDSIVVMKDSLQKTVNDFQEILLGIP